jgi:hypothetical protein
MRREQWITGTLVRTTPDTLVLHVGGDNPLYLARRNIKGLQVSDGSSRGRSAVSYAFIAALTYASATYLVDHAEGSVQGRHVVIAAGGGVAVGALIGVLSPYEHWGKLRR